MRVKRLFRCLAGRAALRHVWPAVFAVAAFLPQFGYAAAAAQATLDTAAKNLSQNAAQPRADVPQIGSGVGSKIAKPKIVPLPKPEELLLPTADGLELAVTYYPGTKGKQTIPVVLLHMWKQNGNDYRDLAVALQAMGHAAIVPDLRGHGQSTHVRGTRKTDALKAATLSTKQFAAMVTQDMKAVKAFLFQRNNAGELNIDKLCIVGAEMGAGVALNFAVVDAMEQEHNRVFGANREFKLGRFVKCLVLLSPRNTFPGLPLWPATTNPVVQRDIAILILVGKKDARAMEEAKRLHGIFQKYHPEPTGEDKLDRKTLFFGSKFETSLQGTKLLDPKFEIPALIGDFIDRRLVKCDESKEWVWLERKSPY